MKVKHLIELLNHVNPDAEINNLSLRFDAPVKEGVAYELGEASYEELLKKTPRVTIYSDKVLKDDDEVIKDD